MAGTFDKLFQYPLVLLILALLTTFLVIIWNIVAKRNRHDHDQLLQGLKSQTERQLLVERVNCYESFCRNINWLADCLYHEDYTDDALYAARRDIGHMKMLTGVAIIMQAERLLDSCEKHDGEFFHPLLEQFINKYREDIGLNPLPEDPETVRNPHLRSRERRKELREDTVVLTSVTA